MNILVTAGNTQTPIDHVRVITNIFTGRTGARIAATAFDRGHRVKLLTSHPDVLKTIPPIRPRHAPAFQVRTYRTFDDLHQLMFQQIPAGTFDAIIHSAAVSDYSCAGIYAAAGGAASGTSESTLPALTDVAAGKVKSSHPEVWLRLIPTPKLVDQIRNPWGFQGKLVKFKLEVDVTEAELQQIAERSRLHSAADLMSANTLRDAEQWALVGGPVYRKVPRAELADCILDHLEG
jgi:phosphopantothenate---cysteine ligase (CTP)